MKSLLPRTLPGLLTAALVGLAAPAHALLLLNDLPLPNANADFRLGQQLPSATQLSAVARLGAVEATWNDFGTINSMINHGGFIATGYSGTPSEAARAFVLENRALFRLSAASVADLEVISEGVTPGNQGRAILFRQHFLGMPVTHDGQITVGVLNGKVYYVSSSSAGDQAPPGPATLSPLEAWMRAAKDIHRSVSVSDVLGVADKTQTQGWTLFSVANFAQVQRARLVAMPIPAGGVRQAYETVVLDVQGANVTAFVHFVDAQTGEILRREDRVDWQSQPTNTQFQGAFPDATSCGPKHSVTVPAGQAQIAVVAAAAQPANDVKINLYYNGVLVSSADTGTSPEALTYAPAGGIPPGAYQAEICPFGSALPPFNYAGNFTYSDTTAPAAVSLPQWKWNPAYPDVNYANTDIRKLGCWGPNAACNYDVSSIASRAPWDVNINTGQSSFTTIGNNAITAEAWGSPLTPAEMYRPTSPTRMYIFPFGNVWNKSKCDSTNLVPKGNDIDAAVTNLFVVHNRMHDWSYHLGFTELNSNLQTNNFGNTASNRENDAEIGNVQAGAISGSPTSPSFYTAPGRDNANQIALQDGVPGITNQYLFQSLGGSLYGPCADGDFDMSVVGHEYTHAISNRMIGGPDASIGGAQGQSMGESWSDLDAAEYMWANGYVPVVDESPTAVGPYATGDKKLGIRTYALDNTPLNYSNVGFDTPGPEVHSDGEIWNAVQWELRQALVTKYEASYPYANRKRQQDCADGKYQADECPGNRRWIQMIFDSFLLVPAAPSMLDARDGMLASDVARFGSANQKEMWRVFAKRGMGIDAYSNGGADVTPVGNFESPLEPAAVVGFKVLAGDESNAVISKAKIYVGEFATRTRPIADTDPATVVDVSTAAKRRATLNLADSARMLPGSYDFIVEAPGYGIHRFRKMVISGDTTLSFTIPTNYASKTKGASVVISATVKENTDLKDTLIDDSENTGTRFDDSAPILGGYAIVTLGGGARMVSSVNVSSAAGPNNPGRFTALRKFEVRTCNGTCANAATDFATIAYTSPDDGFPGKPLRPVQPDINLRSFSFPPVLASHVMLRALTNQCTGQALFAGDKDNDPTVNADCPSFVPPPQSGVNATAGTVTTPTTPSAVVRATEFEVFGSSPSSINPSSTSSSNSSSSSSGSSSGGSTSSSSGSTSSSSGSSSSSSGGSTSSSSSGSVTQIANTPPSTTSKSSSSDNQGRFGGGAMGFMFLLPALGLALRRRRQG